MPPARRKLIAPAAVRHQLTLLERAAPPERDALFHRISAFVNAHGSGGERGRVAKVRASLLARDRPRAYRAVGRADRTQRAARRRARRMRTVAAKRLRSERRRRAYKAALKRPMDEHLAVFAAYWYRGYSCNPRAIYEKARELVPGRARRLGRQAATPSTRSRAGVEYVRPRHARVLRRDRPRARTSSTTSTSPTTWSSATGTRARA